MGPKGYGSPVRRLRVASASLSALVCVKSRVFDYLGAAWWQGVRSASQRCSRCQAFAIYGICQCRVTVLRGAPQGRHWTEWGHGARRRPGLGRGQRRRACASANIGSGRARAALREGQTLGVAVAWSNHALALHPACSRACCASRPPRAPCELVGALADSRSVRPLSGRPPVVSRGSAPSVCLCVRVAAVSCLATGCVYQRLGLLENTRGPACKVCLASLLHVLCPRAARPALPCIMHQAAPRKQR